MQLLRKVRQGFVRWLAHRLPPCREITVLVSAELDRKLSPREWITLRLHLAVCTFCHRYYRQVHLIRDVLHHHAGRLENGEGASPASLSAGARERMKRAMTEE